MKVIGALLFGCLAFAILMLLLGGLPRIIARVSDPPRIRHIRSFFDSADCTDIEVKPWPNHYGVHYTKDGARQYAKCRVNMKSGTLDWVGGVPSWAAPPNNSFKRKTPRGTA